VADPLATKITFLQSADSVRYARLLSLSSQTVQVFCAKNGFAYDMSLGIRYGVKPWHAALNRITILKAYLDRGYGGWVFYVDADAYIADLDFNLKGFLDARSGFALIASPSGLTPRRWEDINNGVFAINLSHPLGVELVNRWFAALRAIPENVLCDEERWGDVADDQEMMHSAMLEVEGLEAAVDIEGCSELLNWEGSFIRQIVRETGSLEQRTRRLGDCVEAVLSDYEGALGARFSRAVMRMSAPKPTRSSSRPCTRCCCIARPIRAVSDPLYRGSPMAREASRGRWQVALAVTSSTKHRRLRRPLPFRRSPRASAASLISQSPGFASTAPESR